MSTKVVILTGAGINAESGLRTFRGPDGLWEGEPVSEIATPDGFSRDPARVQRFYNRLRRLLHDAEPNAAHIALARLQRHLGTDMHLVTQNIDDLHQRAGSTVTAMHGQLRAIRNTQTGDVMTWDHDVLESETGWRPHVVWFGERTIGLDVVAQTLSTAAIFVAIGTSGTVYPANQFAAIAKAAGATTVEINTEPTTGPFDEHLIGPATDHVPRFVDQLVHRTTPQV